jgi:phosphatidylglycerophosphate synthase
MKLRISNLKKADPYDPQASIFVLFFIRPVSYFFTYFFLLFGISANQVSIFSAMFGISSSFIFLFFDYEYYFAGAILIIVCSILDASDGTIARYKKTSSSHGEYVDAVAMYISVAFIYLSIGYAVDNNIQTVEIFFREINFSLLSSVTAIFDILMRLFHNRYVVGGFESVFKDIKYEEKKFFSLRRLSKELTITGFYGPIVLVAVVMNMLQWVVLIYFTINLVGIFTVLNKFIFNHKTKDYK